MAETNKDLSLLSVDEKRQLLAKLLEEKLKTEKSVYPLSYAQKAMWFLYQLAPEESTYNTGFAARICSDMDLSAFKEAFQELVNRHPSLRTTFVDNYGKPMQEVHGYRQLHFEEIDASAWDEAKLYDGVLEAYRKPFDLQQGPVLRVVLFKTAPGEHVFLLVVHHIVFDGRSLWILLNEFRIVYEAKKAGTRTILPPLPKQYSDYIDWENEMLNSQMGDLHWKYWQHQLGGELAVLNLPTDRPHPPIQTYHGASHTFIIDRELTRQLKVFAQAEGATLYMTLLAAFQVLLYRYTHQEDILIGSSVAGRNQADFADIVGYLVNVVVFRASIAGDLSFRKLLQQTRQTTLDMVEHGNYPFPLLVERLKPERDSSRPPIYQVLFDLQRVQESEELATLLTPRKEETSVKFGALTLKHFQMPQQEGLNDLGLQILETDGILGGIFKYNTDLFDASTIARMSNHFLWLLIGMIANPEQQVSKLPLLTQSEQHQLLIEWNSTQADYPDEKCIHELFETQVRQSPDAVAVVFEDKQLTYRELNNRANQLASHLMSLGVKPETFVGICVDRSLEMIIGLLGILKAGGAYVPLDPAYPKERLAFMLSDSQVPVLLTQQHLLANLPKHEARAICLDTDWKEISQSSEANPTSGVTIDNLAYVIYTSGSTGKPKGVLIEHRGLGNLAKAQIEAFEVNANSRVLQFASFSFDAAVSEVAMALLAGATLCLAAQQELMPGPSLSSLLHNQEITTVTLPPSALAAMSMETFPKLRTIASAGEACSADIVARWAPGRLFLNAYGPAEATVCATIAKCTGEQKIAPIGRPIANTQVYILDQHLEPVPVGIPGELYIGGIGLGRGYLNRPDLTAEKFIFHKKLNARLYKTGDLGRYLPNGEIEFLGRVDHQIKLRGFRIELGEIETLLKQHSAIRDALVVTRKDVRGDNSLVAYIIANHEHPLSNQETPFYGLVVPGDTPKIFTENGQQFSPKNLRVYLKNFLPEFMVPSSFVLLDSFPLSPNGKVDRQALPQPESTRPDLEETYIAPQTEFEQRIATVWQDVLQLDKVGLHDNFFDLGGHSLLVAQVHSKIMEAFKINELPLVKLFQYTTIDTLAKYLENQVDELPSRQVMSDRVERQKAALARQKQLMRKVK